MVYEKKKDALKQELARRLSMQKGRWVRSAEIWDRKQTAEYIKCNENDFTNGMTSDLPNYYFVDKMRFKPNGLFLFFIDDVKQRKSWSFTELPWPPDSDEPQPADVFRFLIS